MNSEQTSQVNEFKAMIEKLIGKEPNNTQPYFEPHITEDERIGYHQFNELLLLHGYNKISCEFFQFLCDGETDYTSETCITIKQLEQGIVEAQKLFLLVFGNLRFGYKVLSENSESSIDNLKSWVAALKPIEKEIFTNRIRPLIKIIPIDKSETHFLGYIVQNEIKQRLTACNTPQSLDQRSRLLS